MLVGQKLDRELEDDDLNKTTYSLGVSDFESRLKRFNFKSSSDILLHSLRISASTQNQCFAFASAAENVINVPIETAKLSLLKAQF